MKERTRFRPTLFILGIFAILQGAENCSAPSGSDSSEPETPPKIVSVFPANGSVDAPRNIPAVEIVFDGDMRPRASVSFEGESLFAHDFLWRDARTLDIRVFELLKPGYPYTLTLNKSTATSSDYFKSTGQVVLAQDTRIVFSTDSLDLYFKDVRPPNGPDVSSLVLNEYVIKSLWYNESTVFNSGCQSTARQVIEKGKNPGLGVLGLHQQGITGKGVSVAIIDQNLASLSHPEFAGRVASYRDFGCDQPPTAGSMHAPAVLSLLAGQTIGTAPEADVYFAAAPSWLKDAQYYADALDWIVETSAGLPPGRKIRVVSVSAAPSGQGTPFTTNNAAWDAAVVKAENAGIIVLDCTFDKGIIGPGFHDLDHPDDLSECRAGYATNQLSFYADKLLAPCSLRTQAEEYEAGICSYQYTGNGGLSWTIPYVTGVLAMGFQLKPDLTNDQILQVLFDTGHVLPDGNRFIDPVAFINALKAL